MKDKKKKISNNNTKRVDTFSKNKNSNKISNTKNNKVIKNDNKNYKTKNKNSKITNKDVKTIENNIVYKKVKIKKLNKKNLFLLILFLIAIICLIISIINLISWMFDNKNINNQINKINDIVIVETVEDDKNTEIIENDDIDKSDPYWDYIKLNLIDVDFKELKHINNETKGWIKVNGTNVNYPFVQAKDNDYYLNHAFDKSSNGGGWVFLDYRNDLSFQERNTIIYGHGRQNKTIFGTLKDTLKDSWLNNKDNHIIKLSTEYENTLWQIFSVYRIPTTNDYIQVDFSSDKEYLDLLNKLLNRSIYNFNTSISELDRILTLSTCYNNDDKVVIHAKLIKRETK